VLKCDLQLGLDGFLIVFPVAEQEVEQEEGGVVLDLLVAAL